MIDSDQRAVKPRKPVNLVQKKANIGTKSITYVKFFAPKVITYTIFPDLVQTSQVPVLQIP